MHVEQRHHDDRRVFGRQFVVILDVADGFHQIGVCQGNTFGPARGTGTNARRHVAEHHSLKKVIAQYLEVLRQERDDRESASAASTPPCGAPG